MDEEEFQQSLELLIKNPKKRKATEKKAGKEDAGHGVDASGKKKMKKNDSNKKPKISRAQDMFKAFLQESKEHDREMVEQMMAREREMQASEHSLMREFMGSLTQLLKKD